MCSLFSLKFHSTCNFVKWLCFSWCSNDGRDVKSNELFIFSRKTQKIGYQLRCGLLCLESLQLTSEKMLGFITENILSSSLCFLLLSTLACTAADSLSTSFGCSCAEPSYRWTEDNGPLNCLTSSLCLKRRGKCTFCPVRFLSSYLEQI